MRFVELTIMKLAFAATTLVAAHPVVGGDHQHVQRGQLPTSWYHDAGHHTERLFNRQEAPVADPLPKVGSPEWVAKYPTTKSGGQMDPTVMPQVWVDAYLAAVKDGLIPAIPPTIVVQDQDYNTNLVYPGGLDATSPEVCSTYRQCYNATDIHEAPAGILGISFDDGPTTAGSPLLYKFLAQNHIQATHFMIGAAIVANPDIFLEAFNTNGDLAVHTWTHSHMTAQSDYAVLAELGWTMQVIYDSTGGRVPRYWRPPFGEMDQRVRAIAERVFGLTAVLWNKDTNDWAMADGGQTAAQIAMEMETWLSGPRTPGIVLLSHELTVDTVNVFMNTTWPLSQKYKWKALSTAQAFGPKGFNYVNAKDNVGSLTPVSQFYSSAAGTGTGAVPEWVSKPASTSMITTTPTGAPPPASPAPPSNTATPNDPGPLAPAPGEGTTVTIPPSPPATPLPSPPVSGTKPPSVPAPIPAPAPTTPVVGGGGAAPGTGVVRPPPKTSSSPAQDNKGSDSVLGLRPPYLAAVGVAAVLALLA